MYEINGARFDFEVHKINVLSGFQIDRHDFGQLGGMSHPSLMDSMCPKRRPGAKIWARWRHERR